jgi:hypothetical protein
MSERLNGLRMDEWSNQSAPRSQERGAPMTEDELQAIERRRAEAATTPADVDALLAEVRRLRGDRVPG